MQKKVLGRGLSALMPERAVKPGANVVTVEIDKISFSPFQPRQERNPQKAQELMASIKEKGVIQPVVVRPKGDGYELIAGERRMRAAKELGFTQLPVVIKDVEDAEALQLAIIENIQREELNPLEEAQAYEQLILKFGFTQEKIAQLVSKNPSSISNTLRLLKLPEEIKLALRKGTISMGHARTILGLKSLPEQDQVFRRTVTQQLSVRELENLVTKKVSSTGRKKQFTRNPHTVALEEELQRTLGTKVKIVAGRKRGKIILEYYSLNDMERLTKLLKRVK